MRNQIDYVGADQGRGFRLIITQAEVGIAGERSGESTAGFGLGKAELRPLKQPFRQQAPRHGKAEKFEVAAVGDLERLCRIRNGQITRRTDLFATALRGTPQPFELEVDKAEIIRAQGNVRSKPKHGMPGGRDPRYLDRSGINPRDGACKGLVSNPAWLESYKRSRKVVGPASKGLIQTSRFGRPFHEHPKQTTRVPAGIGYRSRKTPSNSVVAPFRPIKRSPAFARAARFAETIQAVSTCPVPPAKIFRFPSDANHLHVPCRPVPQRGGSRSSRTRGGMRWTWVAHLTRARPSGRRSRVVLTPRRWRQVSRKAMSALTGPTRRYPRGDGGKQARSPGRARNKPVKPSRREGRVFR